MQNPEHNIVMVRSRTRVDDEEALIPRNDMEEFHTVARKKAQRRRSCCCNVKCWFAMFLLLVLASTAVFYFIYPSIVHDNINKFIGFACTASGYAPQANVTITCLVMTSSGSFMTKAAAVDKTWASQCTRVYYFYQDNPSAKTTLKNSYVVDDVTSVQPMSIAFNASDVTSWYLKADDRTYVAYGKLQRLLSAKPSTRPVYVGNDIISAKVGAFALNRDAVKMLLGRIKLSKAENMIASIHNTLNVTSKDAVPGFTINNPLLQTGTPQLEYKTNSCAFENVTVEQMYSFYLISDT